jgi:hypothetical protein
MKCRHTRIFKPHGIQNVIGKFAARGFLEIAQKFRQSANIKTTPAKAGAQRRYPPTSPERICRYDAAYIFSFLAVRPSGPPLAPGWANALIQIPLVLFE